MGKVGQSTRPILLVVDDGKHHVTLLRLALMQRGYAVIVVSTVDGAKTMLRERSVDALLVSRDDAESVLASLGELRPRLAVALATDPEASSLGGFDLALRRPIDFAELDDVLRARLFGRTSGTRRRANGGHGKKAESA
jgi:DNA-binding response OmpR family regulator